MQPTENLPTPEQTASHLKSIAFFDFDGTITNRDSFIDFIYYYVGRYSAYIGLFLLLPYLLAYKLKIIPNWKAKEKVLSYFFKGETIQAFQEKCDQYAQERIPHIVRIKALEAIKKHQQLGNDIYLVSASPENWLSSWCHRKGMGLIASRLEVFEERLTGKLAGKNCYGAEKVIRIQEQIKLSNYNNIYSYGDSAGDDEMLKLADYPYYRPFQ